MGMRLLFSVLLLSSALTAWCGTPLRIVSWNVENLFDCRHDTLKNDFEFLPQSRRQWTWGRYWRKVNDVSRVIMDIGGDRPPALVALQEVENDSVMVALTRRGSLRSLGYEYIITDSPDQRGVDVALLYQPMQFRLVGWESVRLRINEKKQRPTRDLLHAWGSIPSGDTLHVVVCHLPSQLGGRKSKRLRRQAVAQLYQMADSLLCANPNRALVVMGDFNAPAHDSSLRQLHELSPRLLPITPTKRWSADGTYRFQKTWSWIDQMWVSQSLQQRVSQPRLFSQPWMQRQLTDGSWMPRRTYGGPTYMGGVSDHVPFYVDIAW